MERFIAVDNLCAWPCLTLLPNGSIAALVFNQPCHGHWEGDVDCWLSHDGGRRWERGCAATSHEPGTNRMNVAGGLTAAGDLLLLASGWNNRPKPGNPPPPWQESACLPAWACLSRDGGRSFQRIGQWPDAPDDMDPLIPFGNVQTAADGGLVAVGYCGGKGDKAYQVNSAYLLRSGDGGATWGRISAIACDDYNETALLHLGQGRFLAAARTLRDGHLELFRSDDDGHSWRHSQPLSLPAQHPAHLLRLADGRVLLVYGNRCRGQWGIDARLSGDEGRSWSAPARVAGLEAADLGYPAGVQTADGKIVTAWYCGGIASHQRYHMGVALWEAAEVFGK